MPRLRPSPPPLIIPHDDRVEQWLDHFDSPDSIDEYPEYILNLGAESPASSFSFDDGILTSPIRGIRRSRSNSTGKFPRKPREAVDRDCGICFEYAVHPSRTLCCGMIFCFEHITRWLHGPSSDGCCPSCSAPCSVNNILSLASPTLIPRSPLVPNKPFPPRDAAIDTIPASPTSCTCRHRSQSTSTLKTTSPTSSVDSADSSIFGLSPALEENSNEIGIGVEENTQRWSFAYSKRRIQLSRSPFLPRSHSSSSLVECLRQPTSPNPLQHYTSPYPFLNPGSSTIEVISRLASVLGLTLLFYVLLAS